MCGITGFVDKDATDASEIARKMASAIAHRGPDDSGSWIEPQRGIVFGHRRLSILDLSPEGHQPMSSQSGRFHTVYNGEIYNYLDIRTELISCGHKFRGHSDTEIMLAAFEEWGVKRSLEKFNGMFVFALWDSKDLVLTLGRDRIGKKPLYYGWSGKTFLFASELKSIRVHPKFSPRIDRGALALLFRHNYIPAPWSIYSGIYKLIPGTTLTLRENQLEIEPETFSPFPDAAGSLLRPESYWTMRSALSKGTREPFRGSEQDAADRLEELLTDAVKIRMISDVPLGAFLSGGIDSSTIVALMQKLSSKPVRTFSIGFAEEKYNEAQHAKAVATHLGTDHTELYATPADALNVIPSLPTIFDEPFSDSSQIPTYLVSKLCREHVTVSLSGDAGDELFCGYPRYEVGNQIWSGIKFLPKPLRSSLGSAIQIVPPNLGEKFFGALNPILPHSLRVHAPRDQLPKLGRVLKIKSIRELYRGIMSHWDDLPSLVIDYQFRPTLFDQDVALADLALPDFLSEMMYIDSINYLPDDILVKVDRASMAASLEARAPLTDYRIAEFAWSLPLKYKYSEGVTKRVLRNVLHRYVPPSLVERPKMGFGVPIDLWLRKELREWAESLLDPKKIESQGFLNPAPIRQKWLEHLSGSRNWEYLLWDVLMFQAWIESTT